MDACQPVTASALEPRAGSLYRELIHALARVHALVGKSGQNVDLRAIAGRACASNARLHSTRSCGEAAAGHGWLIERRRVWRRPRRRPAIRFACRDVGRLAGRSRFISSPRRAVFPSAALQEHRPASGSRPKSTACPRALILHGNLARLAGSVYTAANAFKSCSSRLSMPIIRLLAILWAASNSLSLRWIATPSLFWLCWIKDPGRFIKTCPELRQLSETTLESLFCKNAPGKRRRVLHRPHWRLPA